MDGRRGWRRAWMLAAVLAAVPAGAQPVERWRPDSLGIAADAVPLPVERAQAACNP